MEMYRVSDLIKLEDIKNWNDCDVITITAGTGVGKSYFIKNVLYDYAKENGDKILFIVHRRNCKNQFINEIEEDKKSDVIKILTYQGIETGILKDKIIDLDKYKYIVADEYQYFCDDSNFNKTSDMSFEKIMSSKSIKIFMSATDKLIKGYIKNRKKIDIKEYSIPISFDFIDSLSFFHKSDTMFDLAKEFIEKGDKGIFFIQSAKLAYELYLKFEDSAIFNCSRFNKEYYKYVDEEAIENMLNDESFPTNLLITTSCMDAGVNIIDTNLKHIVCDIKDTNTLLQSIGRKRIQGEDDKVNIYIKAITNKQLGGIKTQITNKLNKANYLLENGTEKYILEYYKNTNDYSNIIYDDIENGVPVKRVNELMYYKCRYTLLEIDNMLSYGDFGYCKFFANLFNREEYKVLEEDIKKNKLVDYLDSIIGKRLFKEEQKELIEMIELKDGRGRIQKSIGQLNLYLIENFDKNIMSKRVKINQKLETVWIISDVK